MVAQTLQVPNLPVFKELLDKYPSLTAKMVDDVNDIGEDRCSVYESTVVATLAGSEDTSELRSTKLQAAAVNALLGTAMGKLLHPAQTADYLQSLDSHKPTTPSHKPTKPSPKPATLSSPDPFTEISNAPPAPRASSSKKPPASANAATTSNAAIKQKSMKPRVTVSTGDVEITQFLTKSMVDDLARARADKRKVRAEVTASNKAASSTSNVAKKGKRISKKTASKGTMGAQANQEEKDDSGANQEEKDDSGANQEEKDAQEEHQNIVNNCVASLIREREEEETISPNLEGSDDGALIVKKVLVARLYNGKQEFLVHWEGYSAKVGDLTWEPGADLAQFNGGKAAKKLYVDWAKTQNNMWPPKSGVSALDYSEASSEEEDH
jgi:hypothetical protein